MLRHFVRRCAAILFFFTAPAIAFAGGGMLPNGTMVSSSITNDGSPAPMDTWTFDGKAGDFVYIGFVDTASDPVGGSLCFNIYAPDGTRAGCNYGSNSFNLNQTGTWSVEVVLGSVRLHTTVNYSMTLAEAGNDYDLTSGGALSNGQSATGSLSNEAALAEYTMYIPANVTFLAALGTTTSSPTGLGTGLQITRPDGSQIVGGYYADANFTTAVGGNYRFIIYRDDSGAVELSSASFMLTVAVGGVPPASLEGGVSMAAGGTYSGSMPHGDLDEFPFIAIGGQPATVSIAAAGGNPSGAGAAFTVFDPTGAKILSGATSTFTFTPPASGSYRVVIYRDDAGHAAYYQDVLYTLSLTGGSENADKLASSGNGQSQCDCSQQAALSSSLQRSANDPNAPNAITGDPINIATGNVAEQVTDYATSAQNKLAFTRYYNSMANMNSSPVASSLGVNWRHNFDRSLIIQGPANVLAERQNGQIIPFVESGGVWRASKDIDWTLTNSGATWILTDENDIQETYTASGSLAVLQQIKLRNGYTQTLTHSGGLLRTVSDSYGRSLAFTYDGSLLHTLATPDKTTITFGFGAVGSASKLTSVAYTSAATGISYLYENTSFPFGLTGIIDENAERYLSWAYDSYGRAISNQNGDGTSFTANLYTIAYDDSTGNRTVAYPLGQQVTYKFKVLNGGYKISELDRIANATVPAGTRTYGYDGNGYLNSMSDWNTHSFTYANDAHGQPTTVNEGVVSGTPARTTTIAYDAVWVHLPHTVVTPGLTSTLNYDSGTGNLLTRVDADTTSQTAPYATKGQTRTTTYSWTPTGQLHTVRLPRTDVAATTTYTYAGAVLTGISDALGHATRITAYTGGGLPETVVDPNGVTTTLTYDARLNLQTSTVATAAGKLATSYSHDAANNLTSVQQPDGSALSYGYDPAHRLTSTTDRLGNAIVYTLDASGDATLTEIENPSRTVTRRDSASFDALGRRIGDVGGAGQTTAYTYDANGNLLTVTPPAPSGMVSYSYDALNRRTTATDPAGATAIAYDAHDRPLSVKDANGHTTAYVYDGFGDGIQTVSPDSGTTVYRFDADRNPAQIVRPGPQTQNATFDALDRPLATTFTSDATLNVSRSYDQAGHGFGIGQLTSATDQVGTLSLTYDERGNTTQETRAVSGAGTLKTTSSYDAVSRVAGIMYPSGTTVAYGRDSMGRVTSVLAGAPGAPTPSTVVSGVTYEPFGPETALAFGNGIKAAYSYDLDYRPLARTETAAVPVQKLSYAYLANDNVSSITDGVDGRNSQTFGYDALDRLTSAASGSGGYGSQTFSWDPVGNLKSRLVGGISTGFAYASGTNRLVSAQDVGGMTETIGMTPTGNLNSLSIDNMTLESATYSQANRLASITTGQFASYGYDLYGQRLKKTLPGEYPILYQFSRTDGTLLSENDLHKGQVADYIYLNGRPIGEIDPTNGGLYFTHTDRLGTPQKLTDSAQNVAWSALYQPFGSTGMTMSGTLLTQSLRFPGQQFDPESGLNHNGFRDYSPDLGRYLETDPIGLQGGLNTYAYASSSPGRFVDQSGLDDSSTGASGSIGLLTKTAGLLSKLKDCFDLSQAMDNQLAKDNAYGDQMAACTAADTSQCNGNTLHNSYTGMAGSAAGSGKAAASTVNDAN